MPALSRQYRREIIRAAWNGGCDVLKSVVLSSFEMTETFSYFMRDDRSLIFTSIDNIMKLQLQYQVIYAGDEEEIEYDMWISFQIEDENQLFWMVPFMYSILFFNSPPPDGVLQKLLSCNKLEKLDLDRLMPSCYLSNTFWKVASMASKVHMRFTMLPLAKFGASSKTDTLSIGFQKDIKVPSTDIFVKCFKAPALNVPRLYFSNFNCIFTTAEFLSGLKEVDAQLDRTRSIAIVIFDVPEDVELLGLLTNFRRIAPNLETIRLRIIDCFENSEQIPSWADMNNWYAGTIQSLRDHAPSNVKIDITYDLECLFGVTETDQRAISEAGYNVCRVHKGGCYFVNYGEHGTPDIEVLLNVLFCDEEIE